MTGRYLIRLRQDIARWVEAGLIDPSTAARLIADAKERDRDTSGSGAALAMLAALLLCAAILIFVASNWEAFPRLLRVAALFALISAGYVGGAILKTRDHPAWGEAAWLVATAAFGASIALIGQMYHMSGDELAAILTWCAAAGMAALVLRSGPLTVAAVGIADLWLAGALLDGTQFQSGLATPHLFLPVAATLFVISLWTRSPAARHVILLSLIAYSAWLAVESGTLHATRLMALVSAGLFAAAHIAPRRIDAILRIDGRLPFHALIAFLVAMALVQIELEGTRGFMIAAAVTLSGIVAALVLEGRRSRGLRWLAYLGFAVELCLIYAITVGTMLHTAGFFLFAAVLLGILAGLIIYLERRMGGRRGERSAA